MSTSPESPADESREPKWWHSGWVKWSVLAVVLVLGFYVHQDLMGAMAWKKMQKDVAAAGESLDPATLVPAPIPDEKNFGALPIFKLSTSGGYLNAYALVAAFDKVKDQDTSKNATYHAPGELPYLGRWRNGEKVDRATVQKKLAELNHEPPSSTATPLELLAKLCPALAELRAANVTHPDCLFPRDPNPLPWERSFGSVTIPIKMAKVLAYEERLALDAGQPELALEDLKLSWKIHLGLSKDTSLVAGLVSIGVEAIQLDTLRQGLTEHVWNDEQLATIDHELGGIDFLADFQRTIRGETLSFSIPVIDYSKQDRRRLGLVLGMDPTFTSGPSTAQRMFRAVVVEVIPNGWLDQYKADSVGFYLLAVLPMADVPAHRAFPEKEAKMLGWGESLPASGTWRTLVSDLCGSLGNTVKKFAYAQVQIDEASLACRLERYRLAHGSFPETLAALEPLYGPNPHDVLTGQPYVYRRNADGTYLLYSLGWNQKDDGGDSAGKITDDALDWCWLNHPTP